jgi:prepilin-type N-terminal cleavage/methylation domain-containing protein/prepilin-type processing-associated H-X9-DG protein
MLYRDVRDRPRSSGFTLIELITVVAIVGLLSAMAVMAIQSSLAASDKAACTNNLRQIGTGLTSHQKSLGVFPPQAPAPNNSEGSTFAYEGISWHTYILPFIEQGPLWAEVQAAYAANPNPYSAPHAEPMKVVIPSYICPADARLKVPHTTDGVLAAYTSYVAMTGYTNEPMSGIFGRRRGVAPGQVTDGLSNTIMVGERPPPSSLSMGWWYTTHQFNNLTSANDFEVPADSGVSPADSATCGGDGIFWPGNGPYVAFSFAPGSVRNECDKFHYWSLHPSGGNFLFADGSVRFLTYAARYQLRYFATIAGGEILPPW